MKNITAITIGFLIILTVVMITTTKKDTGSPKQQPTMNFPKGSDSSSSSDNTQATNNNVVIKDGVQYVTITVQGGYSPKVSQAKAGVPTKLIMKTNNTYDCSSSLVIRQLSYRGMLPATGETIIDAGMLKSGDTIQGVCGMGMYSFVVKVN